MLVSVPGSKIMDQNKTVDELVPVKDSLFSSAPATSIAGPVDSY